MKKTMILVSILILAASISLAAIPTKINYQGVLKDSAGNVINNPSLSIVFSIYSGVSGGTPLWTETQSVSIEAGLYNVQLGGVTAIPADGSVFDGSTRYLGITVGTDTEMTPRLPMVSVPYAYYAKAAESAVTSANAVSAESATRLGSYLPAQTGGGSFVPVTSGGKLDSSVMPSSGISADNASALGGIPASNYVKFATGEGQVTTRPSGISVEADSNTDRATAITGIVKSYDANYSAGIRGINSGNGIGFSYYGVWGTVGHSNGAGVYGENTAGGAGVYGVGGSNGAGVTGYAPGGYGIYSSYPDTNGYPGYFDGGLGLKIPTTTADPTYPADAGTMVFNTNNSKLWINQNGLTAWKYIQGN